MKNIVFIKTTLIYKEKDLLKAKLIFIDDFKIVNEFNINKKMDWTEWNLNIKVLSTQENKYLSYMLNS